MKRIKYIPTEDGGMISRIVYDTDHGSFQIKFYKHALMAMLVKPNGDVVETFTSTSYHNLHKDIKSRMKELGVVFDEETRVKRVVDEAELPNQ